MGGFLKQSTAVTVKLGPFVDDTDGKTAETGLTITRAEVRVSKNGADIVQKNEATSLTHDEIGYYNCPLDTTDTNTLGLLRLMVHKSGALPVWDDFMVVTANVWDTLFSTENFNVNVAEISDDATAANNLEAACDGGTYNVGGGAVVAASVASAGMTSIADAILTRDWSSVTYTGSTRCVLTALQLLRNKKSTAAGTLTVTKEDDSTSSWTAALVSDETANPIISVDPN